ncbi:hypothetical protein FRC11_011807, partial [Ceratobasidium sp. 423]
MQAYAVMVSIGNISKDVQCKPSMHATVLLGYLPVKDFKDIPNTKLHGQLKGKLHHRAMEMLLEPLKEAVKEGVLMWCMDSCQCHIYPILATYSADSPEQHDMACSVWSGCPICTTTKDFHGTYPNNAPLCQKSEVLSMINKWHKGSLSIDKLHENGLKPWWPFWAELPFVNLGACFMPNLLHQLYKGLFWTHLMEWIKDPVMLGKDANARFKAMPNCICKYGTPDGYSSEALEYLHIEFAKTPFWKTNKNQSFMQQIIKFIQCQEAIQIHCAYLEDHYGHFAPVPRPESRGDNLEEDLEAEEDRLPDVGIGSGLGVDIEGEDEVDKEKDEDGEDGTGVREIEDALVGMQLDPVPEDQGGAVAYLQPVLAIASSPTHQGISSAELVD